MKVHIRDDIVSAYRGMVNCGNASYSAPYEKFLEGIAGKWCKVRTDYMYDTQLTIYNISAESKAEAKHEKYKLVGTMVRNYMFDKIVDDARIGRQICHNCNHNFLIKTADGRHLVTCPNCHQKGFTEPFYVNKVR